jgi:hypothetical protein
MKSDQPASEGEEIARDLMQKLNVEPSDHIAGAYMDLILGQRPAAIS